MKTVDFGVCMKALIFAALPLLLAAQTVLAVPECYTEAALPAHVWALEGALEPNAVVTSIDAFDDKICVHTPLWKGKPVFRREMYVTWNSLYEAYAKAVESKNGEALSRTYTWLRPRPRTIASWLKLYEFEPPQPWGMKMFQTIGRVLQTESPYARGVQYSTFEKTPNRWGAMWLFLHMGGDIIYSDNAHTSLDYVIIDESNRLLQSMIQGNFIFGVSDSQNKDYIIHHLTK